MDQNSFLVFEIMIHLESEFILGSKFIFSVKNHLGSKFQKVTNQSHNLSNNFLNFILQEFNHFVLCSQK